MYKIICRNVKTGISLIVKNTRANSSLSYCVDLVRRLDNENYFCTLLLPSELRPVAFAIRAFNVEVASVADQVTDPMRGTARLIFWQEAIDKIMKGSPPNHPVAKELARISGVYLKRLITCRRNLLQQPGFRSMSDMEKAAEEACVPVLLLLLQAINVKSLKADHAAGHVGIAQGLTNLLRGAPHAISKRVNPFPVLLLADKNVSEESIFRGNAREECKEIVYDIASSAFIHLQMGRKLNREIPGEAKSLLLPAVSTEVFLTKLRESSFDLFDPNATRRRPLLPFKLLYNRLLKSY